MWGLMRFRIRFEFEVCFKRSSVKLYVRCQAVSGERERQRERERDVESLGMANL